VLAPGLRVLPGARGQLEIGLGPTRVRVPDTEQVRRTLDLLMRGETVADDPEATPALDQLAPVLVDGASLVVPGVAAGDVAAAALLDPTGFPDRLNARANARVSVSGNLGEPGDPLPLLARSGVRVVDPGAGPVHAALLLCVGEIDRGEVDVLVRTGVPHLVVRLVEGWAFLGPFVVPGATACLRCIDSHHAADDPLGAALASRQPFARHDRHDGVAEPVDSTLAALVAAWAVRDLVSHLEGERPSSWSTTIRFSPTLASVTHTQWLREPSCGCGWLTDEAASPTMVR